MDAYSYAIGSRVDCIEVDVSRSSDGVLFALHNRLQTLLLSFVSFFYVIGDVIHRMIIICTVRDLQRIARNSSVQVGDLSMKQVSIIIFVSPSSSRISI